MVNPMRQWWRQGEPWIWLNAAAVAVCVLMILGLLMLISARGMSHFWPRPVLQVEYQQRDGGTVRFLGEVTDREQVPAQILRDNGEAVPEDVLQVERLLLKTGNRKLTGKDFNWLLEPRIMAVDMPADAMVVERHEWGNFYGFLLDILQDGQRQHLQGEALTEALKAKVELAQTLYEQIKHIEKVEIGGINYEMERLRLKKRRHELDGTLTSEVLQQLAEEKKVLDARYAELEKARNVLLEKSNHDALLFRTADGREVTLPTKVVVRYYQPNTMGFGQKVRHYFVKLWEFVSDEPREANTEGGIFPAIFGTVIMVIIMSIFVTPFGVVAAVYLREYAHQGLLVRIIRIAVNNLAGVPSIVYGVFGLGFFVYAIGGTIDQLFFPEALPAPTFGTGGLLWASLTLALLTLPVVIVSTEEGLSRIPKAIREGSLALGATKAETLWRTVLPMASPAMMTGMILAVARAAGEVAPLMLVGVVKLAPTLPLDGNAPFLHLDRKFMHLGFHIYDVGFQSPNVEAARPLVYATAFLLVVVIVALNLLAIYIRNRLRERYRSLEQH